MRSSTSDYYELKMGFIKKFKYFEISENSTYYSNSISANSISDFSTEMNNDFIYRECRKYLENCSRSMIFSMKLEFDNFIRNNRLQYDDLSNYNLMFELIKRKTSNLKPLFENMELSEENSDKIIKTLNSIGLGARIISAIVFVIALAIGTVSAGYILSYVLITNFIVTAIVSFAPLVKLFVKEKK